MIKVTRFTLTSVVREVRDRLFDHTLAASPHEGRRTTTNEDDVLAFTAVAHSPEI